MKHKYFIFSAFWVALWNLTGLAGLSQAPQQMSYQAVIRNSSNQLVTSSPVGIRLSIIHGSATGTTVYSETQNPNTNENGLISVQFGGGSGFDTINWGAGPYFLKTEIDPSGGTIYSILGTTQLLSVPYALYASNLDLIKGNRTWTPYVLLNGSVVALPKIIVESPYAEQPNVTDIDGNVYGTVKIGTQVWLNKNLMTTKFNDGTSIPYVADSATWVNTTLPAYCWFNDSVAYKNIAGGLYNAYTVQTGKLCPTGWHVPTMDEWNELTNYLGSFACLRMSNNNSTLTWPDTLNDSRFNGLPVGTRGNFFSSHSEANLGETDWWSSTPFNSTSEYFEYINQYVPGFGESGEYKIINRIQPKPNYYGLSVRCIKD